MNDPKDQAASPNPNIPIDEFEKLRKYRGKFEQAFRASKKWRDKKLEWQRFYDGEQLSDEEKTALKDRGQPEVVINRIKPKIDAIHGMELQSRVVMKAYPRGGEDFETAKFMSEALRYVDYHTQFDEQESEAFMDVLLTGLAWYKHEVVWDSELEAEFKTTYIPNDLIFKDPYSVKPGLKDAKFLFETAWMDLEDATELFPHAEQRLHDSLVDTMDGFDPLTRDKTVQFRPDQYKQPGNDVSGPEMFLDLERKRVRVVTMYIREPYAIEYASHPDFGTKDVTSDFEGKRGASERRKMEKAFPGVIFWKKLLHRLNTCTFTINAIIEEKFNIRPHDKDGKFPFIMILGYVTKSDDKMPYGYVKQMVDPQKEINKRRSKMLHLLNVAQVVMEQGAVEDPEKTRREVAKPDGLIVHNPGFAFEIQRGSELAPAHFQLLQEAKQEIDDAGITRDITGNGTPEETSGKAIQLRQTQAAQVIRKLFSNLRQARKRVGTLWLEDIQHYWKSEKIVRITDDPEAGTIKLNEKVTDPDTGETVIRNNTGMGKYDIIIEESPDTLNLQNEQFSELVKLAQLKVPIPPQVLIEASSLPNKKEILSSLQAQANAQQQALQQQMGMQGGAGQAAQPAQ